MKEETKKLIDWIKKQINIAKTDHINKAWNGKHETYNADYDKAMAFLDSLPTIESHLCRGGYIQDINGTPCCHGDKVKYRDIPVDKVGPGTLRWSVNKSRFEIYWEEKDTNKDYYPRNLITDFAPNDIEKVGK